VKITGSSQCHFYVGVVKNTASLRVKSGSADVATGSAVSIP